MDLDAYRVHFHALSKGVELTNGHKSKVQSLAWSLDGGWLASASHDASIRVWSLERLAASRSTFRIHASDASVFDLPAAHAKGINFIAWCPWRSRVLLSVSSDKSASLWSFEEGAETATAAAQAEMKPILKIEAEAELLTASWHPSRPLVFLGTKTDQILVYALSTDLTTGNLVQTLQFKYEVNEISCSPDGLVTVALGDGSVQVFSEDQHSVSASTFCRVESLQIHTADCFCARFSPDGRLLCTGGADAQVTIWSAAERPFVPLRCLSRMEWPIRALAFNHDALLLAVGTEDSFLALESLAADSGGGQLVAKVPTSRGTRGLPINCIAWHPTRNIFAFAGEEVDDRTGRFIGTIRLIGMC